MGSRVVDQVYSKAVDAKELTQCKSLHFCGTDGAPVDDDLALPIVFQFYMLRASAPTAQGGGCGKIDEPKEVMHRFFRVEYLIPPADGIAPCVSCSTIRADQGFCARRTRKRNFNFGVSLAIAACVLLAKLIERACGQLW